MITREQLELVVQKKKISEVFAWFQDHFVGLSREAYAAKCPFVIVQGPSGCAKTTTLRYVAKELGVPIKEYSDTTDTTAISYEINQNKSDENRSYDRRKATRFEHFVFNNLRFNPLYPSTSDSQPLARADSEFDDSDDDGPTQPTQPKPPTESPGIIIHVESPLMCSRSQNIFISSMVKMVKMIRELARTTPRRIAIVFETLDSDHDILALPTKFKLAIGMQVLKFNPIIKANMKKFIESMLRKYQSLSIDKDTIDTLISDCDGDLQACINTLEMIRNGTSNHNSVYMGLNDDNDLSSYIQRFQKSKRQKLSPGRFKVNPSLLRDITRSTGFFHNLGKIFYQKRLYPELYNGQAIVNSRRSVERPFPTENDTDYLVSQLDTEPKNLMAWLHQHYHRFCNDSNINKATLFLDHLSDVDTISMNSMQSTQFYEMHGPVDQMQLYLAVSSTVYSLYEDQSDITKSSHKKVSNGQGSHIIKTSVESCQNGISEMFSFSKPISMSLSKVVEDHQVILGHCSDKLRVHNVNCVDPSKILTDYLPYLSTMSDNWSELTSRSHMDRYAESKPPICDDTKIMNMIRKLKRLEHDPKMDYDAQHESLLEYIGDIEQTPKIRDTCDSPMDLS